MLNGKIFPEMLNLFSFFCLMKGLLGFVPGEMLPGLLCKFLGILLKENL